MSFLRALKRDLPNLGAKHRVWNSSLLIWCAVFGWGPASCLLLVEMCIINYGKFMYSGNTRLPPSPPPEKKLLYDNVTWEEEKNI